RTSSGANTNSSNSTTSATLNINTATLIVTPDAKSRTYGQAAPTYTFAVTGFQNSETSSTAAGYSAPTCSSSYSPTTPVASSPLTISCTGKSANNYSFDESAHANLTISPATLIVTPDAKTQTGRAACRDK